MTTTKGDPLAGGQELTTQMVGFNKVGDFIKGTYTGKKHVDSKGVNLYEIKGDVGQFHQLDDSKKLTEEPVLVEAGAFYNIWGGKSTIDDLFAKSKFGDIVALQFKEEVPSKTKGNNPFKVFKAYTFGPDKNYAGESSDGVEQAVENAGL